MSPFAIGPLVVKIFYYGLAAIFVIGILGAVAVGAWKFFSIVFPKKKSGRIDESH